MIFWNSEKLKRFFFFCPVPFVPAVVKRSSNRARTAPRGGFPRCPSPTLATPE